MKKILFLALMGLWSVQYVAAQRKGGNARPPEQMVEKLDQKLNLTDEQEKQIVALYTDALKQDLSREERKAAMQEVDKKIVSLLTDEQKTAYEKMKQERPQRKR